VLVAAGQDAALESLGRVQSRLTHATFTDRTTCLWRRQLQPVQECNEQASRLQSDGDGIGSNRIDYGRLR
jgi:hypothetical protein